MYTVGSTVKTAHGERAEILDVNTVDVMNEDGTYSQSTTYTVLIAGRGAISVHESTLI